MPKPVRTPLAYPQLLPAFWPLDVNHNIAHVSLPVPSFPNSEEVVPILLSLAAQSDALRSLQTADGTMTVPESWWLEEAICRDLGRLAYLVDNESSTRLWLRVREVHHGGNAALKVADRPGHAPLEIVCGGLCTWRPKTRKPLYSFIAAAHDPLQQAVLNSLDDRLEDAVAQLRDDLGYDLQTPFKLPMSVTNLIVSGGEAAGHPKHFAYFMPEDEGVDDLPLEQQRTLYFRNVHLARYPTITVPLADRLLVGPMEAYEADPSATLMPWIRGHDHGHNIVLPETNYEWKDRLGIEPFMCLQEAIADAFAFLLCTSKPWLETTAATKKCKRCGGKGRRLVSEDCGSAVETFEAQCPDCNGTGQNPGTAAATKEEFCVTQLAELLHYMRRGPQFLGDPGAMYIELGFLAENGYIEINEVDGMVRWAYDGLCMGMAKLADALIDVTAAAKDERPAEDFLARYGWPAPTLAGLTLKAMRECCGDIPTSLAFLPPSVGVDQ